MPRRVEVSKDLCSRTFGSRFFFRFVVPEGVGEGEPDRSCWGASFVGGASSCWPAPAKGGESSEEPWFAFFFRRSRLAGFLASFVPGSFCRFFFGSGIASER